MSWLRDGPMVAVFCSGTGLTIWDPNPALVWKMPEARLDLLDEFLPYAQGCLKHPSERARLVTVLTLWTAKWKGKQRTFDYSRSHHGAFLHFNQFMEGKWVQAFTFVATKREGVCLRGPEPDRVRLHLYRCRGPRVHHRHR